MRNWLIYLGGLFVSLPSFSQTDSIGAELSLDEIVISTSAHKQSAVGKGELASIDEHLQRLQKVNMIKRGNYAWEPVVNNMQTERLSTTIDGMKIFSACTDRMDPVTSYVESGNLQRISLNSGLDGNPQASGNIGGSLDLKLRKVGFDADPFLLNLLAGVESNGLLQVYGADAAISRHRFYTNFGLFRRHAGNYKSGGGETVSYSQFTKVNAFANVGWQPKDNHIIEATAIYDIATNVGYPALRMDVKEAEGIITSISYRHERIEGFFNRWETKLYYNHITHNMDDTKRPDVMIHMDMPGKSSTAGLYSLLQGLGGRHEYQLNYDLYLNNQYADMTMYPKGGAKMYMLTWPDVNTVNSGLSVSDDISLGAHHTVRLSAKAGGQFRRIGSDEGYNALEIYFTGMEREQLQWQGHMSAGYTYDNNGWKASAGVGYGSRTPVVTESYGYFINNTFDSYDYIGNPNLKNESAFEVNASASWSGNRFTVGVDGNLFLFKNYIIGTPESRLSSMTIGAAGVKIYRNLHSARIANVSVNADYRIASWLRAHVDASYAYGKESTGANLPLIAPVTCRPSLQFSHKQVSAELGFTFAARHSNYSEKYGETETAGYGVCHLHANWDTHLFGKQLTLRGGVENLFDRRYTTYSDWNNILQKGRNFFINASIAL